MAYQVGIIPKFPARVVAGIGIRIDSANAVYTFSTDYDSIPPGTVGDPDNSYVLVQQPDGSYIKVPASDIAAAFTPATEQTGKRNALINGGFAVWQRSTNFAPTTTRIYTADRWGVTTGAGTLTAVQRAAPQGVVRGMNGLQVTGNTGVTVVDISQRIEATNASVLRAAPPYITFSAKLYNVTGATFTPTLFVDTPNALDTWTTSAAQNGAGDVLQSCPSGTLTTITWSADIGLYANLANGLGFRLRIPSGALDNASKTLILYDVQVEPVAAVGTAPTLFEAETFGDELARCQRYFYKTFPYPTAPAQNVGTSTGVFYFPQVAAASLAQNSNGFRWPATMRTAPTVTLFNPAAVNAQARNEGTATDCTATTASSASDESVAIFLTTPAASAAGNRLGIHITADAEL